MNIIIVSYFFRPELTPRAFRTFELVREFCKQGHNVTLILPQKKIYSTIIYSHPNLNIIYTKSIASIQDELYEKSPKVITQEQNTRKVLKKFLPTKIIKKLFFWNSYYFSQINDKIFIKDTQQYLSKINTTYDLLISISYPIETHLSTLIGILSNRKLRQIKVKVAEYSDPFSTEKKYKIFWGYKIIDFMIGKLFNYIVIPTIHAQSSYALFKKERYIKVIPQGFDFSEYKIHKYTKHTTPTFAYAGAFYTLTRNPKAFFDYLESLDIPFKFILFLVKENLETQKVVNDFISKNRDKIEVYFDTDRISLIEHLSKMDFLLNFENSTNNQVPSKLIDYAISNRPICSISTTNNNFDTFMEFLDNNYANKTIINLEDYDIKKVVNDFLKLV